MRVRPNGTRTWLFFYGSGSNRRKLTLGDVNVHPLSKAREWALKQRALIDEGRSPRIEHENLKAAVHKVLKLWESLLAGQPVS